MSQDRKNREKGIRALLIAALILWTVFIFARSLRSAEDSTEESAFFLEFIRRFLPSVSMHFVRKLAHFTEFFILGCLSSALFQRAFGEKKCPVVIGCLAALCYSLAVAVTDELLQLTSPGRSCQISDMLLDFSGAAAGTILLILIILFLKRRNSHE